MCGAPPGCQLLNDHFNFRHISFNFHNMRRSPPAPRLQINGLRQFKWLLRWQHSLSGLSGFQIALILLLFSLHFANACTNEWLITKWQLVAYLGLVKIPNTLWMCSLGWFGEGGPSPPRNADHALFQLLGCLVELSLFSPIYHESFQTHREFKRIVQ